MELPGVSSRVSPPHRQSLGLSAALVSQSLNGPVVLVAAWLSGACLLQVDEGPCRASIERYFYNTITQKCEVFYYGGCLGNGNNFKSYLECQKSCFRIPSEFCRVLEKPSPTQTSRAPHHLS